MPYQIYLAHHGTKGQKWGVKHGPPYPLRRGAIQKAKNKFAEIRTATKEKKETRIAKEIKNLSDPSHPLAQTAKKYHIDEEEYQEILKGSGADPYEVRYAIDDILRSRAKKLKKFDYSDLDKKLDSLEGSKELHAVNKTIDKYEDDFTDNKKLVDEYLGKAIIKHFEDDIHRDKDWLNSLKKDNRERDSIKDAESRIAEREKILNNAKKGKATYRDTIRSASVRPGADETFQTGDEIRDAFNMYMRDNGHENLLKKRERLREEYLVKAKAFSESYLGAYGEKRYTYRARPYLRGEKTTANREMQERIRMRSYK